MSSLNISKDGICWTSLYNLFQKCFASLAEGLFPGNIQSEFILLQLPISMIHLCMHTSLFWEKFFFLFSITPHKVQKTANRSLSAFELQAEQSCLSLCVCLCKSNIHVYISCTPVSYLRGTWGGPVLGAFRWNFPGFSLSREQNRKLHSRFSLMDSRQKGITISLCPTDYVLTSKTLSVVSGIASRVCACFMTRLFSNPAHRLLLHC